MTYCLILLYLKIDPYYIYHFLLKERPDEAPLRNQLSSSDIRLVIVRGSWFLSSLSKMCSKSPLLLWPALLRFLFLLNALLFLMRLKLPSFISISFSNSYVISPPVDLVSFWLSSSIRLNLLSTSDPENSFSSSISRIIEFDFFFLELLFIFFVPISLRIFWVTYNLGSFNFYYWFYHNFSINWRFSSFLLCSSSSFFLSSIDLEFLKNLSVKAIEIPRASRNTCFKTW